MLLAVLMTLMACSGQQGKSVDKDKNVDADASVAVEDEWEEECVVDIYQREPQPAFDLVNRVTVKTKNYDLRRIVNIRPEPVSNIYQNAKYLFSEGKVDHLETEGREMRYIREDVFDPSALERMMNNGYTMLDKFNIQPIRFSVDFSKIDKIYDYDISSRLYKENTCKQAMLIDPYNPEITSIANELWAESHEEIIAYARLCYEKTARMIRYTNKPMVSLKQILTEHKGCCGDFTSILVSLLRAKNIPSRHVMALCPNNTYHIWAEFYMARYGWIPADATYKNSDPEGDYFGKCDGENIVVQRGIYLQMEVDPKLNIYVHPESLQQHYSRWWGSSQGPNARVDIQQKHTIKK